MKKRVSKYKLKYRVRRTVAKILITLLIAIVDVIIYHYLGIYGHLAVEKGLASSFIQVGWFWLLAGQFIALYMMWE